jgi:hypothetical protein
VTTKIPSETENSKDFNASSRAFNKATIMPFLTPLSGGIPGKDVPNQHTSMPTSPKSDGPVEPDTGL